MEKKFVYILSAVVLLLVGAVAYLFLQNKQKDENIEAMAELMEFEKEQAIDEYENLAMQYDGYQVNISNDSLAQLLSTEQQRVQDLLEELRITKATNAKRINELKKELATVRAVMVEYVHQIDSLDRQNKRLVQENTEVRQQYQAVQQQNQTLTEEKTKLTEVVTRASMMEVDNFVCTPLNKRDRKTSMFGQIQKLQFNFSILKNVATQPGTKTVYFRLSGPDGELMLKPNSGKFSMDNGQLSYSLKKSFEYGGEQVDEVLYWPVEEVLQKGTYIAEFFIDGNMIGSYPFRLD